jgi:large subunit ribosomal protein L13
MVKTMSRGTELKTVIVDAKSLVLGRMASEVAKRLLNGESIVIINAEEAVVSGKRLSIIRNAEEFLQVGHHRKGPLHFRNPERIVKKVVRGMLPRTKPCGIEALKRLKVYTGSPEGLKDAEKIMLSNADASNLRGPYIKVSDLARNIGWKE